MASCLLVSACGSGGRPAQPSARRTCPAAQKAAAGALHGQVRVRITASDPSDIHCRLAADGTVLAVEAQTSAQAWVEYDTTFSHFAQVFGPTNIHNKAEQPRNVTGVGPQAFWVPAQLELVTTNAQEGSTGTYVTVTVIRHRRGAGSSLPAASAIARAMLAAAPGAK